MKKSKKLLISVFALVVTLALATSATFAWFTTNDKVEVGSYDVNVTTGSQGLYVSADKDENKTYSSNITAEQIKALYQGENASDMEAKGFTAVTSADGKEFTNRAGTSVTANSLIADEDAYSYISFTLYFRSTVAMDVYLNGEESTSADRTNATEVEYVGDYAGKMVAWTDAVEATYGKALTKGQPIGARAADAVRMSFVNGNDVKVWNPGANRGFKTGNMALDYEKAFTGNSSLVAGTTATPTADLLRAGEKNGVAIATTALATGGSFYEATVTINLWLEGNDGDCMNDIFEDNFKVALGFIGVEKTA